MEIKKLTARCDIQTMFRGQLWLDKSEEAVDALRFVLVLQTNETIRNDVNTCSFNAERVLVCPISPHINSVMDIPFYMPVESGEPMRLWIQVSAIFHHLMSTHHKFKYVGMMSPSVMATVDKHLMLQLIPNSLVPNMVYEDILQNLKENYNAVTKFAEESYRTTVQEKQDAAKFDLDTQDKIIDVDTIFIDAVPGHEDPSLPGQFYFKVRLADTPVDHWLTAYEMDQIFEFGCSRRMKITDISISPKAGYVFAPGQVSVIMGEYTHSPFPDVITAGPVTISLSVMYRFKLKRPKKFRYESPDNLKGKINWANDDNIMYFLDHFKIEGLEKTAKALELSEASVKKYYHIYKGVRRPKLV